MGNDGGQWDLMGRYVTFWRFPRVSAVYAERLNSVKNRGKSAWFHYVPIKSQIRSMGAHGKTIEKPEFGFLWIRFGIGF
jgi:hypothetical protein